MTPTPFEGPLRSLKLIPRLSTSTYSQIVAHKTPHRGRVLRSPSVLAGRLRRACLLPSKLASSKVFSTQKTLGQYWLDRWVFRLTYSGLARLSSGCETQRMAFFQPHPLTPTPALCVFFRPKLAGCRGWSHEIRRVLDGLPQQGRCSRWRNAASHARSGDGFSTRAIAVTVRAAAAQGVCHGSAERRTRLSQHQHQQRLL